MQAQPPFFFSKVQISARLKPMTSARTGFRIAPPLLTALLLALTLPARAHDPGLSTAMVFVQPEQVQVTLAFAVKDAGQIAPLDESGDGVVSAAEFARNQDKLSSIAGDQFTVAFDGQAAPPATTHSQLDAQDNVEILLTFTAREFSTITVQSKLLGRLAPGHRQFFTLQKTGGPPLVEKLLGAGADTVTVQVGPTVSVPTTVTGHSSFADFLVLGVKHIWTGYDHLLFLFALLVVTRNFKASLLIITCFTLAHSLTLAVATLNLVQFSPRLVEPLIAASIVYVGVENIFSHGEPKGRWILTFGFGLVHGFGFASVLRELGVGANGSGIAVPLISFNLGVELGQIGIAALALPLIWKLRTRPVFVRRWVPATSMLTALLGGFWFVQRVWF